MSQFGICKKCHLPVLTDIAGDSYSNPHPQRCSWGSCVCQNVELHPEDIARARMYMREYGRLPPNIVALLDPPQAKEEERPKLTKRHGVTMQSLRDYVYEHSGAISTDGPAAAATQGAGAMADARASLMEEYGISEEMVSDYMRQFEQPQPLPTAGQLARALFEVDDRVHLHVLEQSDLPYHAAPDERFERNMRLAYARGIFGYEPEQDWADDAWLTAEAALDVLRRRS